VFASAPVVQQMPTEQSAATWHGSPCSPWPRQIPAWQAFERQSRLAAQALPLACPPADAHAPLMQLPVWQSLAPTQKLPSPCFAQHSLDVSPSTVGRSRQMPPEQFDSQCGKQCGVSTAAHENPAPQSLLAAHGLEQIPRYDVPPWSGSLLVAAMSQLPLSQMESSVHDAPSGCRSAMTLHSGYLQSQYKTSRPLPPDV
jgi:hypothetical protein